MNNNTILLSCLGVGRLWPIIRKIQQPKQLTKRSTMMCSAAAKVFMLFSTAVLGIFTFDTCLLLGVKEAGAETSLVPSFCFQSGLRENETSVSFYITAFR